jgi:DNA-directed RNA polymerase subunit M
MLKMRSVKTGTGSFTAMTCANCGYFFRTNGEVTTQLEEASPPVPITVVGGAVGRIETMPTTHVECPQCRNKEAEWWLVQTSSAGEPSTQFYRCTRCGHTWREYD